MSKNAWENISPELTTRAKGLLRDLMMLSYAPTQSWKTEAAGIRRQRIACPSCRGKGPASCPRCKGRGTRVSEAQPHGTKQHHHESAPPPRCDSLYERYVGRFAPAVIDGDEAKVEALCIQVETELARYRGQYRTEMELPDEEGAAMSKVVEVYVGVRPGEVSRRLARQVPPGWVEKARRAHRRDPKTGIALEGWAGMTDEERASAVKGAVARGWDLREAARRFGGLSHSTLHRHYGHYWRAA